MASETAWLTTEKQELVGVLLESHQRAFSRPLIATHQPEHSKQLICQNLFACGFPVLAHGAEKDPDLSYANAGPGRTPRCSAELSRHSHQLQRTAIHDQQGPDLDPLGYRRTGLRPGGLLQRLVVALRRFGFNTIPVLPTEPGGRDRIQTDGSHPSGSHPAGADCDGGRSTQSADVHSSEPSSC